jgi:hypothetical protein
VWISAEIKIGSELAKTPRAKGRAGPGRGKAGAIAGPAFSDAATLKEIGVDKKRASRAKKLAAMPVAERNWHIEQLKEAGKGVTPNAVLAACRKEAKTAAVKALAVIVRVELREEPPLRWSERSLHCATLPRFSKPARFGHLFDRLILTRQRCTQWPDQESALQGCHKRCHIRSDASIRK